MRRTSLLGLAAVVATVSGCAAPPPPVTPLPDGVRRTVATVSGDVSGRKFTDTSKLGARGSAEGADLGARQAAALLPVGGPGFIGLAVLGVGLIVGGVKGASEAQSEDVVDQTRAELRKALGDADFTELLRARLASSKAARTIEIVNVTSEASPLAQQPNAATSPDHMLVIEYRLGLQWEDQVNPKVGVIAVAAARVRDPRLGRTVHDAAWVYCGTRRHFVQMAANNGALLREQIDRAAAVLSEAIPFDLYVSRWPRHLVSTSPPCMDFSDLPSGIERKLVAR
jgi:hypothetical protein